MASFNKEDIYTATEVVRNFSTILNAVSSGEKEKAVIVKNNRFEAVLLSVEEYERMQEAVKLLEKIYNKTKRPTDGE